MSLEGKVCIVTGASSGIGEAIAVLFAERKASVVLCGRSESRLERSLQRCQEVSGNKDRFVSVLGDLTDRDVRTKTIQTTIDVFGRIDVLIANAGILSDPVAISETTEEIYHDVMKINVESTFFLIKQAIPWLEKTKGNVVCISSIASNLASASCLYHMSKVAVDHMCRCLAIDLGPKDIRVNTVNPTFVQTRLMRYIIPGLSESDNMSLAGPFLETKAPLHPLHGRISSAEEIARATAFLACDEASFVTGQTLAVDGGISLSSKAF